MYRDARMQSLRSHFYYHLMKRQLAKSRRVNLPIDVIRANGEKSGRKLGRLLKEVDVEGETIEGLKAEWIRPKAAKSSSLMLYLHGGAYIFGSIATHRRLAAALAIEAGASALIVEYRRAPEDPFPAAVDDALRCYLALRARHPQASIAVAGDSAGGGLAVALCLRLRDGGFDAPAALALLSPWADLTLGNMTHETKAALDPFFPDRSILRGAAAAYAGRHDLRDPSISPQLADLSRLPPTLIHVGSLEALLDDAIVLNDRMSAAGTSVELEVFNGMWHVWQAFAGMFPEADQSVARLGAFLGKHLAEAALTKPMIPRAPLKATDQESSGLQSH
jgi:acetyl esterase/lipase